MQNIQNGSLLIVVCSTSCVRGSSRKHLKYFILYVAFRSNLSWFMCQFLTSLLLFHFSILQKHRY